MLPFLALAGCAAQGQGAPVIPADGLFSSPISGLERTGSEASFGSGSRPEFDRSLIVEVGRDAEETNATQITIPNSAAVKKGDVLIAEFWLRGAARSGGPARVEFLFERSTSPWTKSATFPAVSRIDGEWRSFATAFRAAEDYAPGAAMASLRLAFGPQRVELGGLKVRNLGAEASLDDALNQASERTPLGPAKVVVRRQRVFQTLQGLGGNFCQPRYGSSEPMDSVGELALSRLDVRSARIGMPMERFAPEPDLRQVDGPTRASLLALQRLKRKGIPVVVSVWEAASWLLPGEREAVGKRLPPERYSDCAKIIADYLELARRDYGVEADYFSFNEPDYGVNFRFSAEEMAAFIRIAGPEIRRRGLKTRFLTADTANGAAAAAYAKTLLETADIAEYLGPVSFHSWDALSATEASYRAIAAIAKSHGREVWCAEAGHDAQLWQRENPWESWDNALRLAMAYSRTLRLTGASQMMYWTYQDNYSLAPGGRPAHAMNLLKALEAPMAPGSKLVELDLGDSGLEGFASVSGNRTWLVLANPLGAGVLQVVGMPAGRLQVLNVETGRSSEAFSPISIPARSALIIQAG